MWEIKCGRRMFETSSSGGAVEDTLERWGAIHFSIQTACSVAPSRLKETCLRAISPGKMGGGTKNGRLENLANRGLIKNIMAGCIAAIQKCLLDGNVHSIPAWERARILDVYVCKTVKTTQLWDRDFMGALLYSRGHVYVCVCIHGDFIFSCGCACTCVCVCASVGGAL